jgi:hypothetical protein
LGLESGAEFRTGRETRAEFGESLAPEKGDNETLGSSILFTSRLYHKAMPFTAPSWARKITKKDLVHRKIDSWEYGYWWIEWGGNKDIVGDNELIRYELLSIVLGVWDYIKNSGDFPDSLNWAMDWVGMMPGKRGGRRITGDHILTQQNLMKGSFEDAVAIGGWSMDDHPPGGFDRPDLPPNTTLRPPEVYDGWPQHQRDSHGIYVRARDGYLRCDRAGRGHRSGALRGGRDHAKGTRAKSLGGQPTAADLAA